MTTFRITAKFFIMIDKSLSCLLAVPSQRLRPGSSPFLPEVRPAQFLTSFRAGWLVTFSVTASLTILLESRPPHTAAPLSFLISFFWLSLSLQYLPPSKILSFYYFVDYILPLEKNEIHSGKKKVFLFCSLLSPQHQCLAVRRRSLDICSKMIGSIWIIPLCQASLY